MAGVAEEGFLAAEEAGAGVPEVFLLLDERAAAEALEGGRMAEDLGAEGVVEEAASAAARFFASS